MKKQSLVLKSVAKVGITASFLLLPVVANAENAAPQGDLLNSQLNSLSARAANPGVGQGQEDDYSPWVKRFLEITEPARKQLGKIADWTQKADGIVQQGQKAVEDRTNQLLGDATKDGKAAKSMAQAAVAANAGQAIKSELESAQVDQQCKNGVDAGPITQALSGLDQATLGSAKEFKDLSDEQRKKLEQQGEKTRLAMLEKLVPAAGKALEFAKKIPELAQKLSDDKEAKRFLEFAVTQATEQFNNQTLPKAFLALLGDGGIFSQLDKLQLQRSDFDEAKIALHTKLKGLSEQMPSLFDGTINAVVANCNALRDRANQKGKSAIEALKQRGEGGFTEETAANFTAKIKETGNNNCDATELMASKAQVSAAIQSGLGTLQSADSIARVRDAVSSMFNSMGFAFTGVARKVKEFQTNRCEPIAKVLKSYEQGGVLGEIGSGQSASGGSGNSRTSGQPRNNSFTAVPRVGGSSGHAGSSAGRI